MTSADSILHHYMQTPEGRQKLLASAYEPAWVLWEYLAFGEGPEPGSPERFVALLDAVPPGERTRAWEKLRAVVDAILERV